MSKFFFFSFNFLLVTLDPEPKLFFLMTSQVFTFAEATITTANSPAFGVKRTTVNILATEELLSLAVAFGDMTRTTTTIAYRTR
jgi:hypothetical protein